MSDDRILSLVDMKQLDEAKRSVAAAAWFSERMGSKVFVLTVAPPLGKHLNDLPEKQKPDFVKFVEEASQELNVPMEPVFGVHESVVHEVVRTSNSLEIDLIVMTAGPARFIENIFGSKASNIALRSKCSVFIVR